MPGLAFGSIELTMDHARACGHGLNRVGTEGSGFAHAVPMSEASFEHIGQDFHIAMRVGSKTSSRRDSIFVDNPQRAKTHMPRIVVARKRKAVITVDPAKIGMPTLGASTNYDHYDLLLILLRRVENRVQRGNILEIRRRALEGPDISIDVFGLLV